MCCPSGSNIIILLEPGHVPKSQVAMIAREKVAALKSTKHGLLVVLYPDSISIRICEWSLGTRLGIA